MAIAKVHMIMIRAMRSKSAYLEGITMISTHRGFLCFKIPVLSSIVMLSLCLNANSLIYSNADDVVTIARDLANYRIMGPLILGHTPELRRNLVKNKSEIRQFIWDSFKKHILAHVTFTSFSLEGAKTENSIFVEPDKDGIWHLQVNIKREYQSYSPGKEIVRESQEYDAYTVIRIIDLGSGKNPLILFDSDPTPSREYELRLIDKDGKSLGDI